MAQVKYFDKRTGITYVYESQSYYDPEKRQSRSKRKLIGKIDPETGEVVPTGRRGRPRKDAEGTEAAQDIDYRKLYEKTLEKLKEKEERLSSTEQELKELKASARNYRAVLQKISDLSTGAKG